MRAVGKALICAIALALPASAFAAPAFTTIHTFSGTNGEAPQSALLQDAAGALYGTTNVGGTQTTACPQIDTPSPTRPGCGVVFKLTPPAAGKKVWTETVLHDFKGGADGTQPAPGLVADKAGNLYGVTVSGGTGAAYCPGKNGGRSNAGCGIVYKLARPAAGKTVWVETVLFRFTGANGAVPLGTLILDGQGNLYGTTIAGGATAKCAATNFQPAGCGVAFKLTRPAAGKTDWTQTVLHIFTAGLDGARPAGGLVFDKSGNLYGVTREGGGAAACRPNATLGLGAGCGIAFKLSPSAGGAWTETVIRRFAGKGQPANPIAALIFDAAGNLYGTSNGGGGHASTIFPNGGGTVFTLSPPASGTIWTQRVLHVFGGTNDVIGVISGVIADPAGNLYGTAYSGASASFGGAVYKLTRPAGDTGAWKEELLVKFPFKGESAIAPVGGLLRNKIGNLFGTTIGGQLPPYGDGSVFRLTP